MNSYRFNSGQDPSDEMLAQIMQEVATDAKKSNEEALSKHLFFMRMEMKNDQVKWAARINKVKDSDY